VTFDFDLADFVPAREGKAPRSSAFYLANPPKDIAFDLGKLSFADLAQLELHLYLEQLLAERRIVFGLSFSRCDDLVEHESQAADKERIEDEH
jgi:hypothetical protein